MKCINLGSKPLWLPQKQPLPPRRASDLQEQDPNHTRRRPLLNQFVQHTASDLKRHILAGIITAGPLFVTWLLFTFILGVLANAGLPLVRLIAAPFPGTLLSASWFQYGLAVLLTVAVFYVVGRATSRVVGQQMFALFEASLERLPLVNKIYTSVRQAIDTLTAKKENGSQRVVLIDFPLKGQKSIGFLTHILADTSTGTPVAAVLVPQAINPSSAYLQLLPMDAITETDITMEQAMSMLLTGGAVCPDVIRYSAPVPAAVDRDGEPIPVSLAIESEVH
ncbi:DUF502 domain-containing protein [Acidobacteria bacterium AB60]|nr:DUF502 domain-containing protein [Acidobacteria bacterium AB60]